MTKGEENEWLRKRLDTIIQLMLEQGTAGAGSVTGKIHRLIELGYSQAEVAQIVGKKGNYVSAIVASTRKSKSAKKAKKKAVSDAGSMTEGDEGL